MPFVGLPTPPSSSDALILTRSEYKLAENIDLADTSQDARIDQSIVQVTQAIRRLTDRDFGSEVVTTSRVFPYHGGGIVSIDDCSTITSVTMDGRSLAYGTDYRPEPWNEPVFFYLDLFVEPDLRYGSPLGPDFMLNLNTSARRSGRPSEVTVEASFGWPVIPEDVKLAAIEMVRSSIKQPDEELQSESLAEYSWTNQSQYFTGQTWPRKAVDILATYRRPNL
jgi:hypothetical protein